MIITGGEIVMTTIRSIFRRFQQSVVRFADFIYAGDSIGSGAQLGGQRSPFVSGVGTGTTEGGREQSRFPRQLLRQWLGS